MRNFIRAALVIGTLATPMIASAGDAPAAKTKTPAKTDKSAPAKDADKTTAPADGAKKDDKAAPADGAKKDDAKTPAKDVKAAPKKPAK